MLGDILDEVHFFKKSSELYYRHWFHVNFVDAMLVGFVEILLFDVACHDHYFQMNIVVFSYSSYFSRSYVAVHDGHAIISNDK